jgi:hypothetical protein
VAVNNEVLGISTAQLMETLDRDYPEGSIRHAIVIVDVDNHDGHTMLRYQATSVPRHVLVGMLETVKHRLLDGK